MIQNAVSELAESMVLGAALDAVRRQWGSFELLDHWQQGEFHHDTLLRVPASASLPAAVLVLATNCNGGVKEVLCFGSVPDRSALWHSRCPENPEFSGQTPELLALSRTIHWFDPCELLRPDARSELREEFKERQCGGGWMAKKS